MLYMIHTNTIRHKWRRSALGKRAVVKEVVQGVLDGTMGYRKVDTNFSVLQTTFVNEV